jgi:hypothetical protein
MMREPAVGWFGQWILDESEWLSETNSTWFVDVGLTQALAMAACPLAPEWSWTERLTELAVRVSAGETTP